MTAPLRFPHLDATPGLQYKSERIDAFLAFLQKHEDQLDVICVQECYETLFLSGGYRKRLIEGAKRLGFLHAACPPAIARFPGTLSINSGLVILSRFKIVRWKDLCFGPSVESFNVNRGALHAELENGIHVVTAHVAPDASANGPYSSLTSWPIRFARRSQADELVRFIGRQVPSSSPLILAADLNLNIRFSSFHSQPILSSAARYLLSRLHERCDLVNASLRSEKRAKASAEPVVDHMRPTFGYTGEDGSPAERWITTYGGGMLRSVCDDAILCRGMKPQQVKELCLVIPEGQRPIPEVTHITDHWALTCQLELIVS
ncbi:hypothetical protein GUITHDRAFT_117593 [Guillardia theta CCMP2712]|uniref:Endonuclease/exonuclease/phosphatase domain-containing protein n=1 Tax=Guillardia theta (strain CCMP2712) TaxID=905079 RepID=L1IJ18_GUITC|nr:hypothetical protein GUITHDRAFT_117593 [Guillardia theta CCMP2712]EKX36236.1 hypothetical protein GUITHDRAFT_117593 [Guillardia theta CCMP2712]|eukprot:XP_005823216.1 hypothetical protein GUITHDRAFT_117593 [Guillardia theta CCMP2712]